MRGLWLVYERMVNMHGMFESVSAQLDECRDFLSPLLQRLDSQCQVGFEIEAKWGDSRKGRPLIDVVMSLVLNPHVWFKFKRKIMLPWTADNCSQNGRPEGLLNEHDWHLWQSDLNAQEISTGRSSPWLSMSGRLSSRSNDGSWTL